MKNTIYYFLLLIISASNLNAQMTNEQIDNFIKTANSKELVQKNTVLLMDGFFEQSIIIAEELLKKEPKNPNFNYRKGFAIFSLSQDFSKAIPYLLIGKEKINANADLMSHNEKSSPNDALFYLARSYHLTNNISEAKKYYQAYIDTKPKNQDFINDTQLMLTQCENAEEIMEITRSYEIINLGSKINSKYPDYTPVISLDGSVLYFTSRRLREDGSNKDYKEPYTNLYKEDIYRSDRIGIETWAEPKIMEFSSPERNEAIVAVSSDERTLYVYKDDAGNGDIFETEYKDSQFENLVPIKIKGVNTNAWEPHITSSADGKYKYFSSDRDGGFGGRDIYRITKLPNGEWSEPMNLGPTINTEHDEDSPFISIDNKTLYFSHNGEKSIGGFDVFVSVMSEEDQSWSDPINLGYPLNSTGDDIYYTTTADGLTGFYTSFRDGGYGEKDIYEVRNDYLGIKNAVVLTGKIAALSGEDIPEDVIITLSCINCENDIPKEIKLRESDGSFFTTLEKCREYEMKLHHNNGETEFYSERFKTECVDGYNEIKPNIVVDLNTMSVEMDEEKKDDKEVIAYAYTPLQIKHYFSYNGNRLNPTAGNLKELFNEMILQAESGRSDFILTINASASKVPTRTFKNNMNLANKRADNVINLLKEFVDKNDVLKDKVQFEINKIGVNGPTYVNGDYSNIDKYAPYQFVIIQLNGQTKDNTPINIFKSKDDELKNMPN
ncbi:MAG TPA: hypothetical protein VKY37_04845 [Brumimicrobium sp.]|nr:hypothetical protein [Brumimicrobium sp.]